MALGTPVLRAVGLAQTWPFTGWRFGESICLEALLRVGGNPAHQTQQLILGWIAAQRHLEPPLHLAPGVPMLIVAEQLPAERERVLAAALQAADGLLALPRGRHGAALHRPDLEPWQSHVWVDCMQLHGPFLARLGAATRRGDLGRAAVEGELAHAAVLQDDSGLFSHGFDDDEGTANGIHWARGQGWALLGLIGTLDALSQNAAPGAAELRERLHLLLRGLAARTDGGRWHTVVDVGTTPFEASLSAFVALGIGRAKRAALVSAEFDLLASQAYDAARGALAPDGALVVSDATPVSRLIDHYAARSSGVFPWGQGPYILMELERPSPGHDLRVGPYSRP